MTRKLHNTLMATIASSSLLVVGLIASTPVAPELNASTATAVIASIDSQATMASGGIDAFDQAQMPSPPLVRYARHSRQSLAMPFFSFAPRS